MNAQPHAVDSDISRLQQLREERGYSRPEIAKLINKRLGTNVSGDMVGRWEHGTRPSELYQRTLAEVLDVSVTDLGVPPRRPTRRVFAQPRPVQTTVMEAAVDDRVATAQQQWVATRRVLNGNRLPLAKLAARVYPEAHRFADTGLIYGPGWIPDAPIDLDAIGLDLVDGAPTLDGSEPESAHVRPCMTVTRPFPRYTMAIRDLDRPRLFDNRLAWRLAGVDWTTPRFGFAPTSYFAAVDVNEVVAHELAMVATAGGRVARQPPTWRDLPYRRLVGDPFDFTRRPMMPAISTLTIRGGGEPVFILHRRDSKSVTMAGGTLQVIPSGIFQPSSVLPEAAAADFSLWANVVREYAEELLGYDEHDGDGRPVDYAAEPFATLTAAKAAGRLRIHCLGVALDALTLVGEILTVAVIDPDVFDELSRDFVEVNPEGEVVGERPEFTEGGVRTLLESGRMAPAGAGCLALAWRHRKALGL